MNVCYGKSDDDGSSRKVNAPNRAVPSLEKTEAVLSFSSEAYAGVFRSTFDDWADTGSIRLNIIQRSSRYSAGQ